MRKVLLNIGRVLLLLMLLLLVYALYYFKPMDAVQPSLSSINSSQGVTVTTTSDLISFEPSAQASTGFIFYPGAFVDPRAYAFYMHNYAEHGIAAFIIKLPYDFAFFDVNGAENIITQHPDIHNWVIGGHSLGGVVASTFVAAHANQVKGLVLYASYPASDISSQISHVSVLSISGSNDGLATPDKIHQNKSLLPTSTDYVVIQGGIHGYFGDYGVQSGDGQPTISRDSAHQQIIDHTLAFLEHIQ